MADTPSPVFINLISDDSDDSEDAPADVDMEQSSENGGPPDGSDSEGSMIIPRVPSPQGSEDDETDVESETGDTDAPPHRAPEIRREVDIPASGQLTMPRIERPTYTMDHSHFSPALAVPLPLPGPFAKAGLQNSEHANQWLNHIQDNTAPMPPYADNLSGMNAAVFLQLTVNLQREATILPLLGELLTETESSIIELERLEYLVARVANGPVMRAAAEAQGVTLQIPPWLRDRAAAPRVSLNTNTSDNQRDATESGGNGNIASRQSAASAGRSASKAKASSSNSGAGAKRGQRSVSRAVVHPVTFPCVSGILEESLGSSDGQPPGASTLERSPTFARTSGTQRDAGVRQNATAGPSGSSRSSNARAGPSNSRRRPLAGSSSSAAPHTGARNAAAHRRHSSDEADAARPLKKKRR